MGPDDRRWAGGGAASARQREVAASVQMTEEPLRVLVFNLAMDPNHSVLGFTLQWIRALARRVEHLHVVTMTAGEMIVPGNVRVHSLGKEQGRSEPRRALELYRIVASILRRERVDVCFSHMVLIFPILAAPLLRAKGIPLITWYAHPDLPWQVRVAHHLSQRVVTSLAPAYPYKRDGKLRVIGQGIDTNLFSPDSSVSKEEPPLILCVGRLSPVKDHPTLLKAAARLKRQGLRFRLAVIGSPLPSREEHSYAESLRTQVRDLGIEDRVRFIASLPLEELPARHRLATLHVNMTKTGSGDKTVLEALACGNPSMVANAGFRETFGAQWHRFSFAQGSVEELSEKMAAWLDLPTGERAEIAAYLMARVVALHDLEGLADRLVEQMHEVMRSAPQRTQPPTEGRV